MSGSTSNPFRRDSRRAGKEVAKPDLPHEHPKGGNSLPSLKVQVPVSTRSTSTTKHVRIASPPVPVSPNTPASYPSSPEVTRHAHLPGSPPPSGLHGVPYAQILASNPFQASLSDGEQDDVDEELLENTRRNSTMKSRAETDEVAGKPDPVKATLARFAGTPRKPTASLPLGRGEQSDLNSNSTTSRPALDVDAFKRLLLTGESEVPVGPVTPAAAKAPSQSTLISDSSSSNADTASVSRQSIFEPVAPPVTDSPRTSFEADAEEVLVERRRLTDKAGTDTLHNPPFPKQHHGKAPSKRTTAPALSILPQASQRRQMSDALVSDQSLVASPSDLNKPLPPPPIDNSFPLGSDPSKSPILQVSTPTRRPPTPPLSRRRSQHRSQSLPEPGNASPKSSSEVNASSAPSLGSGHSTLTTKAPQPPPTRRQNRASDIAQPLLEPAVHEEDAISITTTQPQLSPSPSLNSLSQFKPQPPPSRNPSAAKRLSRVFSGSPTMAPPPVPPPVPPPRRVRGSGRNSFDSQMSASPQDSRISGEFGRPSTDSSRHVSSQSTSNDILADLAALQADVDALRKAQRSEASST